MTLFVKAVGPGSRALCALAPGDVAQCLGPLGRPFTPPPAGTEALLVAGGYGVAPFRFMGERLRGSGRARAAVLRRPHARPTCRCSNACRTSASPVVAATEDGSLGARGRVTVPLEAHLDAARGPVKLYACGPEAMMHAVARIADRRAASRPR